MGKDLELFKKVSPLGSKMEDDKILIFTLATLGQHYSNEDWERFLEYRLAHKKLSI